MLLNVQMLKEEFPEPGEHWREEQCPLLGEDQCCQAVNAELSSDCRKKGFCHSDDYERCSRFLAYLLRRSRPNRTDHDWLDVL